MKNRWIALYVENEVGVLAKVSGLFSGKSYNLQSLTVGTTEDMTVSRMTICVTSDDITFEQIKKQLNRMVEVIKVIDLTDMPIHMKEILFAKVKGCSVADKAELFQIAQVFHVEVADMMSIGVAKVQANQGAVAIIMNNCLKGLIKHGVKYLETGPELETNHEVQNLWKNYNPELVKRHRCWGLKVNND